MAEEPNTNHAKAITYRIYALIALLSLFSILILSLFGYQIFSLMTEGKAEDQIENPDAYASLKNESLKDISDRHLNPAEIRVGIYLERIEDVNIKDEKWTADFTIWFIGHNESDNQYGRHFSIINGHVDKDNIECVKYPTKRSYSCYYKWEVKKAEFMGKFDTCLYPSDTQYLTITIENPYANIRQMMYSPDKNSSISDRANLTGFKIDKCIPIIKQNIYNTNFGDPILCNESIYSQFNYIIKISRPNAALLFLNIFIGLIVAVFVSVLALWISPAFVEPRFGLGVGGLFAAVANYYIASSSIPITGNVTLIGLIHGIGIVIIFFAIAQSVLSLYIYETLKHVSFSEHFDRISFIYFLLWILIVLLLLRPLLVSS